MPPPTLMIVKNKGTGDWQVRKLLNGTTLDPVVDGNDIVETLDAPNHDRVMQSNLLVEAFGKRFIRTNESIRERNAGGDGNWGVVHIPSGTPSANYSSIGLYVVYKFGQPVLVTWQWAGDDRDPTLVWTEDGDTWTELVLDNTATQATELGPAVVFGASLVWTGGTSTDTQNSVWRYDFEQQQLTTWVSNGDFGVNIDATETHGRDFLVLDDSLFMSPNYSIDARVYRLDGVNWTVVPNFPIDVIDVPGGTCLINDGNDLIQFTSGDNLETIKVYRIQDPLIGGTPTYTDITSTVEPSGLSAGAGFKFWKYLDTTTPGSPQWYIWICSDNGVQPYDCYQWNGISSAMTLVGAGVGSVNFTIVHDGQGGRARIPALSARPQFDGQPGQVVGGRRRFFRVYGTGSDVNLRQYHNSDQEAPNTLSTLVASSITMVDTADVTGLVGNANETTLEGLSPSSGDAYVLTDLNGDRTLNPGSLSGLIPGDIVSYSGSAWTLAKQALTVDPTLIAYWKFDNAATDRTPNGHDLTLTGSVPYTTGLFGQAADFPGTNGNYWTITTEDQIFFFNQGYRGFTLSLWVNADTLSTATIMAKDNPTGNDGWYLGINGSGDLTFGGRGTGVTVTALAAISAAAGWQHVVVVSSPDANVNFEIYVDGTSAATNSGTALWAATTNPLRFGNNGDNNEPFDGQVCEVALWNRPYLAAEVTALYNSGSGVELGLGPDFGTHAVLSSTTALISPYTDGADDGETASFSGKSMDGIVINSSPTNTSAQINGITPDNGATQWSIIHDVTGDGMLPGDLHTLMLDTV